MEFRPLAIEGAWEITPRQFADPRGVFLESYNQGPFSATLGHRLAVAQTNISVSAAGVVRGIHFSDVPPGQAKYVTCVRGAVLDVIVDIRVGSPTYGVCDSVRLDEVDRRAVYLPEGLGHAFVALTDDATVTYLCSEVYHPTGEHGINPLDPALGIEWPSGLELLLSPKDEQAPTLAQARADGLLPDYAACLAYVESLRLQG